MSERRRLMMQDNKIWILNGNHIFPIAGTLVNTPGFVSQINFQIKDNGIYFPVSYPNYRSSGFATINISGIRNKTIYVETLYNSMSEDWMYASIGISNNITYESYIKSKWIYQGDMTPPTNPIRITSLSVGDNDNVRIKCGSVGIRLTVTKLWVE